jgi:hypothetical protein
MHTQKSELAGKPQPQANCLLSCPYVQVFDVPAGTTGIDPKVPPVVSHRLDSDVNTVRYGGRIQGLMPDAWAHIPYHNRASVL